MSDVGGLFFGCDSSHGCRKMTLPVQNGQRWLSGLWFTMRKKKSASLVRETVGFSMNGVQSHCCQHNNSYSGTVKSFLTKVRSIHTQASRTLRPIFSEAFKVNKNHSKFAVASFCILIFISAE
jgi:hypothetical protein